jgi:hypothetical protein
LFLTGAVAAGLMVMGCHRKGTEAGAGGHKEEAHAGEHHDEAISFKMGKGLAVPAKTAQIIGLKVEDVKEREVIRVVRFDAQVYRSAAEGRLAAASATLPTVTLASGQVNRTDAEMLSEGKEMIVRRESGGELRATVREVHEMPGKAAGRAEVVLAISDPKRELKQGERISAVSEIGSGKAVAAIPKSALLRTIEGKFVYTVSGERYVRTAVTPGATGGDWIEITDGLYPGDQIVVHPVMTLWMAELQAIRGGQSCADGH